MVAEAEFGAGGSQQQPLEDDETLMGGEAEEKAQSHLGEVGSSQEMNRCEEPEMGEVEEVGMGTHWNDGVGLIVAPGAPMGGWPSSACLAWGVPLGQKILSKETRSLMRSWMRYQFEELGQIYLQGSPPSWASHLEPPLSQT